MSHEQFPAFRLVTLIMRQISSPIARRIAAHARSHPRFSRTACVRISEWYRSVEWRLRCAALRAAGRRDAWAQHPPPPLPLTQATDMGADILGEAILFILGAAILIFEVNRQANVKEAKEQEERNAWLGMVALVDEIDRQLKEQQTRIDALRNHLLQVLDEQEAESKETEKVGTDAENPKADTKAESPKVGIEAENPKAATEAGNTNIHAEAASPKAFTKASPKAGTEAGNSKADTETESPKSGTEAKVDVEAGTPKAGAEVESLKAGTEAARPKVGFEAGIPKASTEAVSPKVGTEAGSPKVGTEAGSPKVGTEAVSPKVGTEAGSPKVGTEAGSPKVGTEAVSPKVGTEAGSPKVGSEAGSPKSRAETEGEMEVDLLDELPIPNLQDNFTKQTIKEKHRRCKPECCCDD